MSKIKPGEIPHSHKKKTDKKDKPKLVPGITLAKPIELKPGQKKTIETLKLNTLIPPPVPQYVLLPSTVGYIDHDISRIRRPMYTMRTRLPKVQIGLMPKPEIQCEKRDPCCSYAPCCSPR